MNFKITLRSFLPWFLLLVLGGTLIVLYHLSSRVSDHDRIQVESKVRQMQALDTDINLDVLRLRYRQLRHYDSVAGSTRQMESLLDSLQKDFEKLDLHSALSRAQNEWSFKQTGVEDFKRQNSVLVNSLFHFVNLADQMSSSLNAGASGPLPAALVHSVTEDVLIFVNGQQTRNAAPILEKLKQLEAQSVGKAEPFATRGWLMAAHGRLIVNNHQPVQVLMRRISSSVFSAELEQAYNEYISAYNQASAEAENYRRLMAIFSFMMIVTVMLMILRLRQTAAELERSHTLLNNVADHLGEGILSFDARGMLNFVNKRAEILLQRDKAELIGRDMTGMLPDVGVTGSAFQRALTAGQSFEGEEWLLRSDGTRFPAVFLGGALPSVERQAFGGYVTSFRDLSTHYEAQARLRLAARVFDNLSEGMTITGVDGLIESVNPAFTSITGFTETEAKGHTPGALLSSGMHDKAFYQAMWEALRHDGKWQGEIINRKKNGETFHEWLSITAMRDDDGHVMQYIALFSDISERKQIESHIHHLAYHDPLTGLANRLLFTDRLENAMRQAHRTRRPLAIVVLDLDRFKQINDSLGHALGDILLKFASQRLLHLLREGDTLARVGGDEFALLLPEISSHADVATLASHILREFETPFDLGGREVFTSVSIGISAYPSDGETPEVLMKNADVALYNAKDSGRSAFRFFLESDSENSLERLELESALRHSVAQNELRLYYQPQVDARSGLIYGVEALVRWQHPLLGLLPPTRFIPLAEATGYIDTLGRWCLQTACRQLVAWQQAGIPIRRMAVNVSARQLSDSDFMNIVFDTIQETGIHPGCLELELTESSLVDNPERVFGLFALFRERGIRIAIDDFGTGYSSLSYLSRYPVDVLKIDKSFIDVLGSAAEHRSVVQAMILMAHAMDMGVVAEGVETEAQSRRLGELGCDLLQGYLYSRPVPPENLVRLPCVVEIEG
ncbi:MAG: EAL domain-containing protein [Zoogloeaceae bacterium]|jgi:diguanylate cyclase (GGDEF)-like protein/PAS domain S-box-containing protein|nr:EAL domain-containing protein [Zoogloeaceae bacterium]